MRFRLQNCLILVLIILLNTCLLPAPVFAKVTQAQVGARGAEQNRGREEIDLGGWWKMDKIRPGQGVKEEYHNFPPHRAMTKTWISGKVPGDVYTDLWRAGAIDDPYYGRNIEKTKWVVEYEWWYTKIFGVPGNFQDRNLRLIFGRPCAPKKQPAVGLTPGGCHCISFLLLFLL